ncbi:MAG: type II toxin-antitoxin system RelE family toxin [Bacillota bacterium]
MSSDESTPTSMKLTFKRSAWQEAIDLDGSVKKKVLAQLLKIRDNPLTGEPLRGDLAGCRKIYVNDKRLRIVWQVQPGRVVILGVGKRDKDEIYRLVQGRFDEQET